uniref:IFT81 calponin homology domain-containing protein n=1 Tax=Chlamydomonas leiostraca TaxID=1034604 RepID=A0A7S0WQ24_9CHLO|mmetsp:Transcript_22797/g.57993  ORF Transcript_22797/g.57993 Transcript_22797/m.57993 type:complete len:708 (+) Transcript_22797:130-2253(+)|eukprot:CAMPEP_0202870460 /NCGR_PEP_ID=MMETSP1391-20130828/15821_1 /ASSEMBLY_ACC=CAM_ASM_000867 /TAXON_ID=1034604 /ORGANISM="Chlamydomonas leiostraca, Strain SAG 11-49" /LENGTH=707 /DNA_ID=CAMNT_0049551039 /DNA_START=71 /DNA_END=2194 /DNA_ORIENTATION=-
MGDIHYIVDKLNQPPFQYNLTLLSFSEKTPQELLQLVSDIFTQISPKHQKVDISKEDPDNTVDRLVNFLKIIKYKPNYDPVAFRQLLAAGDKDVVYPILKWVVPQPQQLEKRAFVGHYLSFPDMPEEFNFDPDVMELKEEIKQLQAAFVDTHKSAESVKALNKDTQALKVRITSLVEEKDRLQEKVERARGQVDKVADKASYMDVCAALRKAQDDEVALSTQMQTQKQLLEKAEGHYNKVASRLKEIQASHQEGSAARLLEALQEDVGNLRFQVNERYPKELEKRQKRSAALQEAFTNGVNTEGDLQRLQAQANTLHAQIQEITERRAQADKSRTGDRAFMQLRQAQQMASMVARKREEIASKHERLVEKKAGLTAQLEKLTAADGVSGGMVSEEEWRLKYEAMKAALPTYKKMKKELGDIEAEVFVLAYTEEVLAAQEAELQAALKSIEKKQGIAGFADVVSGMEKVSEAKSAIDEVKGMTLTEISRTVEEINTSINERKVRLAPQIKKLRAVRAQFAELEAEHAQSKGGYDAAMAAYDSRVSALESEVSALKQEVMDNESKYHALSCQLGLTDQAIRKVSAGPAAERLRALYQQKVAEAEETTRVLKDKQKDIRDTHTTGLSQIDMMNDLVRLLQIKVECQRREAGLGPSPGYSGGAGGNTPPPAAPGTMMGGGPFGAGGMGMGSAPRGGNAYDQVAGGANVLSL